MRQRSRRLTIAGTALAGAVAGHILSYWFAHPHADERHSVLESSGHGYMQMAISLALVAAIVALMGEFALGHIERRRTGQSQPSWGQTWAVLGLVQTVTFVSVEIAERALAGAGSHQLLDESAFWLGLPLQVLLAACGAFLLSLARRAGSRSSSRLVAHQPLRGLTLLWTPRTVPVRSWTGFDVLLRGPPAAP